MGTINMAKNKVFIWTVFVIIAISLLVGSFNVNGKQIRPIVKYNITQEPYEAITLPDIAYWEFDEGVGVIAYDKTKKSNDGFLINNASWTNNSVSRFAIELDGFDDGVVVPTSLSLNPKGSFTIDAWIYPKSFTQNQIIIAKWADENVWKNQRAYSFHTLTNKGLRFAISDVAHQLDAGFHNFNTPANVLTLNQWNHVTATYNQITGTRKIYVEGVEVASRTDPPITILNSIADLGIGIGLTSPTTSEFHFDGYIDEVKIYGRVVKP
jgi:hypothetical protein